jgi:hypothetical protein
VPAEGGRAAIDDVTQHGLLPWGDTMVSPKGLFVRTKDVGDLEPRSPGRPLHDPQPSTRPSGFSSRSSGMRTREIKPVLIWV